LERPDADAYEALAALLSARGRDVAAVEARLRAQAVETPSWGYGDSGTRFAFFTQAGRPRDAFERIEDAAEVHRHTGICPSVAIHIPWDRVDGWEALRDHAAALGLRIGSVHPNLFQDEDYRLGSVCHPDPAVRRKATEHLLECVDIAGRTGADVLSVWLADGTNYPGQDSFAARRERLLECLSETYGAMPDGMRMLVEYKLYEPAFYHSDIADWGDALLVCRRLGDRARVLVDLGHHAHGTNIERIVSTLLDEGRLGGFHFNDRKYGDDDLITGSVNPLQLFLIHLELADAPGDEIACAIDQSHNVEDKIAAMIVSVANLQEAYARALLVDRAALAEAQAAGDVVGAHEVVMDAYRTDVRPLCAKVRSDLEASARPLEAHRAGGYLERAVARRGSER
jgi:L-rhamnose isomerase/sugar isomerase